MKKVLAVSLVLTFAMLITIPVHAYDLPIDINAIGRRDAPTARVTHRIGANLFTQDAQRVNDIFAQRIQQRQETALTLFDTVATNYETDSHNRIMTAAYNMALFSQPTNFTTFNTVQEDTTMPTWLIVLILALCAAGGFVLALKSIARRKRSEDSFLA